MESIRRKIVSKINFGSNKFVLLVLQNVIIFLNFVHLNHFREKNLIKKCKWLKFIQFCGGLDKGLYDRLKKFIFKIYNLIWVYKYIMLYKIFKALL